MEKKLHSILLLLRRCEALLRCLERKRLLSELPGNLTNHVAEAAKRVKEAIGFCRGSLERITKRPVKLGPPEDIGSAVDLKALLTELEECLTSAVHQLEDIYRPSDMSPVVASTLQSILHAVRQARLWVSAERVIS